MEERIQHLTEQGLRHANENPTETEMAFYNHKQGFFLIQECDDGYDYTFANKRYELLDGGQLDVQEITIYEAAEELLKEAGWENGAVQCDYEETEEKIQNSEKEKFRKRGIFQ